VTSGASFNSPGKPREDISSLIPCPRTHQSIAGVILNVEKKRLGFAFWIFSNAAWAIINF
jgi:hypothetical protein